VAGSVIRREIASRAGNDDFGNSRMTVFYALVTVLAWGTWLAPSQNIKFKNSHIRTFYISAANLILTFVVLMSRGTGKMTAEAFWLPFAGGLIWAVSGYCAFMATEKIGMARAMGVWAPLNIIAGMLWGALLFDEFAGFDFKNFALLLLSLVMFISGALLIIFARGENQQHRLGKPFGVGLLGALGAGVLWGTYFIPIRISNESMWVAAFPLAVGMLAGSALFIFLTGQSPRLSTMKEYALVSLSGVLWGVGNYGMLLLTEAIGTGKGFTISQLGVVVNALVGIFLLKDPKPGTRAASITFAGVVLAMLSGIILGNLK